jgi:hypothetical protein
MSKDTVEAIADANTVLVVIRRDGEVLAHVRLLPFYAGEAEPAEPADGVPGVKLCLSRPPPGPAAAMGADDARRWRASITTKKVERDAEGRITQIIEENVPI